MEEIFDLLATDQTQKAIDIILERLLAESNDEFIELLINNLNRINAEHSEVIKAIYTQLLKLIGIENDVLRYSLVLSLKTVIEQDPQLVIPFAKEYLISENANTRESIVQLLAFVANTYPNDAKGLLKSVIPLLADKEDFVQKKTIEFLQTLGKHCNLEVEERILEFLKDTTDEKTHENAETVLKKLVSIKNLESEQLEKKHLEIQKKVLDKKEKDVTEEEVKLKQEEIKKREEEVAHQKVRNEQEEINDQKRKELEEKEQALRDKEFALKEARLNIEEKEKEFQEEIIRRKAEMLEQEMEINRKRAELEKAENELELKELQEKEKTIIEVEDKRVEKRLNALDKDHEKEDDEDYEKLETESN
ncbi:MAG: hypothetical protein EU530_00725 [Promethearchaeota archaeon]|nr:MAG: hypothetical protein EU530_00725 [Candidatus Lokiarchaeota archaeon]